MTNDGYLSVVDRKKDMIKTGGENVARRELEEVVYQLDGVAEVAVFGIPHPRRIEAVVAVVVPRAGTSIDERTARARRLRLAGYKCPKHVVVADALPEEPEREDRSG
jgi:fatty-acyl-CoA synthase